MAKAGAQVESAGGDLTTAWEALRNSESLVNASEDLRALYRRAEETVREAEVYRQRIQSEARAEFGHLSREARKSLKVELEAFMAEADKLFGCWPAGVGERAGVTP